MAANPTKKAVVANGSIEVIGGGVRPGGGVAIPNAAEGELCAMVGEMKSTKGRFGNGQLMACLVPLACMIHAISHDTRNVNIINRHPQPTTPRRDGNSSKGARKAPETDLG